MGGWVGRRYLIDDASDARKINRAGVEEEELPVVVASPHAFSCLFVGWVGGWVDRVSRGRKEDSNELLYVMGGWVGGWVGGGRYLPWKRGQLAWSSSSSSPSSSSFLLLLLPLSPPPPPPPLPLRSRWLGGGGWMRRRRRRLRRRCPLGRECLGWREAVVWRRWVGGWLNKLCVYD